MEKLFYRLVEVVQSVLVSDRITAIWTELVTLLD